MATKDAQIQVEYEEAPRESSWMRRQLDQVNTLVIALLLALAIRAFVIEPFRIPSGSMFPTLLIGDHLFVNKFIYGVKLPLTSYRLPALRKPVRGDVIVFTVARDGSAIYPVHERPDLPREEFVKRIVGVPGDTIEVRFDTLYVNGRPVDTLDTGEFFTDDMGRKLRMKEERVNGHQYTILDNPQGRGLQQEPIVVAPGSYFVMGDNRDHSNDSRAWGMVELPEIKGPAFVLYWSWDFNGGWIRLANPLTWWDLLTTRTRWSRIGERVD